jgi:hypothetical protein
MKFTAITATLFTVFALSRAIPIGQFADIDDLVERSFDEDLDARDFDFDALDARDFEETLDARDLELMDLEARTGPFNTQLSTSGKNSAKQFVQQGRQGGQLAGAAAPGNSAKTTLANNAFHLDRQQPTNAQGQRKVAVQLNNVGKGQPSTVGQVAIHGNSSPSSNKVAKKMDRSITTGRETHINHPNSKSAQNTAANQAASAAKSARLASNDRAGQARAAAGNTKKGKK